ncbi:unnamed protein product [Owenia fusiformis]|uniref:RING-type domain-containing protein n=1 Tax=Owenia fusiformis TaxID=6347 RepID=A0A8S4Q6R3_OWEFU|nr:unnamed protein product [Owenia fusiformis]
MGHCFNCGDLEASAYVEFACGHSACHECMDVVEDDLIPYLTARDDICKTEPPCVSCLESTCFECGACFKNETDLFNEYHCDDFIEFWNYFECELVMVNPDIVPLE